MTKEDKELLIQDLCARLMCNVMLHIIYYDLQGSGNLDERNVNLSYGNISYCINRSHWVDFKPYLRPLSSMTEDEFNKLKEYSGLIYDQLDLASFQNGTYKCLDFYLNEVPSYVVILVFDWLNKNHFDYRGLIERDLAIAVTEENNPYK